MSTNDSGHFVSGVQLRSSVKFDPKTQKDISNTLDLRSYPKNTKSVQISWGRPRKASTLATCQSEEAEDFP